MGLMLSILIVCVGVIEALSCYEHFQYGVIRCATNVYKNARRRSSAFLQYTSRRLKLLSENSMPEHDEGPEEIEPYAFAQDVKNNNTENFNRQWQPDQVDSTKPAKNSIKQSKKLGKEDKIQIVKTLMEKPARPKTVRSISMPEMIYTERDIQLSEIINNLAIEPIEEVNIEIDDINTEVLTKEFDKLFDEYENSSGDGNETLLDSADGGVVVQKESKPTKKEVVNNISNKCRENQDENSREKLNPSDVIKNRKNIEKLSAGLVEINSPRRISLGNGDAIHLKKVVKPLEKDEKGSPHDRFTSADFDAVTVVKSNKSKSVDLDVFPSFYKFHDDSSATEIFMKEPPILDESNNKLVDAIFENETPPIEVVDKTFEEIYNDICDNSANETNEFEEIEKSILSGFEWKAKTNLESKTFGGSQVVCEPNEAYVHLPEEKILSNNCGVVKETLSDAVLLKAAEQLAELIIKDSLNLSKIKNLILENLNNAVDSVEDKTLILNANSSRIIPENTTGSKNLNVEYEERRNDENLKENQRPFVDDNNLSMGEESKTQKISSVLTEKAPNPSTDILKDEKLASENFNNLNTSVEISVTNNVNEEVFNRVTRNHEEIPDSFKPSIISQIDMGSFPKDKTEENEQILQVETELHVKIGDNISECNKVEIKSAEQLNEIKEADNFSINNKESRLEEDSNAKNQSELAKNSETVPEYKTLLALEYKEIKPASIEHQVRENLKELESIKQENTEQLALEEKNKESEKLNLVENNNTKLQVQRTEENTEAIIPKQEPLLPLEYKEAKVEEAISKAEVEDDTKKFLLQQEAVEKLEKKEESEKPLQYVEEIKPLDNKPMQVTKQLLENTEESEQPPPLENKNIDTEICSEPNNYSNLTESIENSNSLLPKAEILLPLEYKEEIKFENDKKETSPPEHKIEKDIKTLQLGNLGESTLKLERNAESEQAGTLVLNFAKEEKAESEKLNSDSGKNTSHHSTDSKNELNDDNKQVKATDSAPEAFWLIFSGEYTKAMSKDWHSGHFSCWQCDEALTGQRYVLRDDHPYCIKCYESVFANVCEECNKIIGIDSKDLSYKDKHWHEACFLCNKCRVSLVDKQFGSKADKIYCGNCYDAQFASRCDGCGEIFRAGTKKMEYKTRQWHEKCFCCCVCKTPIGTKSFIPREQEIYCATCYEEKFATRCVKCNKIITSGGVTYKNEPWHRECFTCTNCNTSLAGQRFTSRDEKPYCADCFGELFAKRCTACSRPITGIGGTRFISFEDRHWHNDCFICASCKTSLVGRGFITDGDDIICPECAKQKLM